MRQTRNARALLGRAARAVLLPELGVHFIEADPPTGGGANPKKDEPPAPKKLEITEDELQSRIDAALKSEREKTAAEKKKADDAAAAEEARKKGEFEKLAKDEQGKREQAERDNASLRIDIAIRDHLADEKLRDYAGCAKYIKPLIDAADASDADKLSKSIQKAVEQYVKDNPRQASGKPPVPPGRSGGASGGPQNHNNSGGERTAQERDRGFLNRFQPPRRLQPQN